ncbi:beta-ketoacyl synthase chain length factor [Pseudomonas panipatensis]|uniref:beta-ketoacyl synthase chain length factor n=1 Tax=Pseudomonas panipatensis TaxID=428992 RepID=UPI0035B1D973
MIQLNIDQWSAWAPGLHTAADWQQWDRETLLPRALQQPDIAFLPAMQRRRLSPLARMAFAVAWPLAEGRASMPLIFVSRHGETPRSLDLLRELAADQPLSPTQFSLSVHNAVIGLWSILRQDSSEMSAIAGERDGLEHGVLEAAALLAEGAPEVLLIIAEESPPELYSPWIDDVPFSHAVALRLAPGDQWQLRLEDNGTSLANPRWPNALSLVRGLLDHSSVIQHPWKKRLWTWQRNH